MFWKLLTHNGYCIFDKSLCWAAQSFCFIDIWLGYSCCADDWLWTRILKCYFPKHNIKSKNEFVFHYITILLNWNVFNVFTKNGVNVKWIVVALNLIIKVKGNIWIHMIGGEKIYDYKLACYCLHAALVDILTHYKK